MGLHQLNDTLQDSKRVKVTCSVRIMGSPFLPMVVLAVLPIYFGVYASPLLNLIRTTMAGISVATQMGPQ